MSYCFGIDIGGTTVKLGLFETTGNLLEVWEIPTRTEEDGKYILSDIAASIEEKIIQKDISKTDLKIFSDVIDKMKENIENMSEGTESVCKRI